ncbi:MAG: glycoside hydrolase domain-containing protein [Armatimonadia bacterium]
MKPLAILLLFACLATDAFAQGPVNLLQNPGMEELTASGFAAGWRGGEFGKPGTNVVSDSTVAHSGKSSIRVGLSPRSFVTCAGTNTPVKPKTTYYITWWCKTQDLKQARAYVWLQTNKAQRTLPDDSQFATQDWTQHFAVYTTAEDETSLAPVLTTHDTGDGTGVGAWFDDLGLYEGSFPAAIATLYQAYVRSEQGVCQTAKILSKTADLTLWTDDLAAKVYREDGVPDYAKPAKELQLSAARNEQAYAQLVITPAQTLQQVNLLPHDLKGPTTIAAAQIDWSPVGYATVKTVHRQGTRLGATPDPLLPPAPVEASAGQNTPFLLSVRVPLDARPGTYRGAVDIVSNGKKVGAALLALRVYDFALPRDPAFRTLITFSPTLLTKYDKRPLPEIEKDICRVLYDHRIRGNGATATVPASLVDGKVVCDFKAFDEKIGWALGELGFNAFFLGPMFGGGTSEGWEKHSKWLGMEPLSADFNRLFPDYMRQVAAHLREKGWLDKAYLYLWDEPEPDYFDKVVALQKLALQGDPGLKVWETTSPAYKEFWGVVKAWSVPFGRPHFDEKSVDLRRAAGDEIWVYNIPCSLEIPSQVHRLWFWQAARYGAIGAQLWNVTFYNGIDPWEEITPRPYKVGRGGTQLFYYDAGAAIMLYPNPQGGRPYPSLRLKLLQKGLDDFDYLSLLQQRLLESARKQRAKDPEGVARERTRQQAAKLVRDIGKYNMDCDLLSQTRDQIARQIETLSR